MSIGAGIAVAAMWGCVAITAVAPRVSGVGMSMTAILATMCTIALALH